MEQDYEFKIGEWDDLRSFDEICEASLFTYFFCYKNEDRLAPGDNGKPHIVLEENDGFLKGVTIEACGGITTDSDFSAGKLFIEEVSKDFGLRLYKNPKEAVADYFRMANASEYILKMPSN